MREDPPDRLTAVYLDALPRLRRLAAAMGFGPIDVDDLLQRVYVSLRTHPPSWRGPEAAEHWLYRTTVNACRQEYRHRARFQRAARDREVQMLARGNPSVPDDAERRRQHEAVRRALLELPVNWAVPLVLRYCSGWDATRIGALLGLPPSTVRARLRRARLWLADRLDA